MMQEYHESLGLNCYARHLGNAARAGENFQILSEKQAREWAGRKLSAEEYCKIFGEPEEG